jgi:hypothetical protein
VDYAGARLELEDIYHLMAAAGPQAPALKLERGATWARNCDTHRLFRLPSAGLDE